MSSILIRLGSCGRIRSRTSRSAISRVTGWALSLLCAKRRLMAPSRSRPLWGMMRAGGGDPRLQDSEPQFLAERSHLDHKPAGEARTHAVVEALEVGRRTVRRDHDLATGVDQGVQG